MAEYVIMPKADYESACDATRAKTGKTDLIKSGELGTEIGGITVGSDIPDGTDVTFGVTYTHAYFNDVLLPAIPENVLAEYPYAWIRNNTTSGYYDLLLAISPWYSSSGTMDFPNNVGTCGVWYRVAISSASSATEWELNTSMTGGNFGIDSARTVLWSNHDIPNGSADATEIYFEGTEPQIVPVFPEREEAYSFTSEDITNLGYAIQQKTNDYTLSTVQEYTERVNDIALASDIPDGTNVDFGVTQEPIITHAYYNGVRYPVFSDEILYMMDRTYPFACIYNSYLFLNMEQPYWEANEASDGGGITFPGLWQRYTCEDGNTWTYIDGSSGGGYSCSSDLTWSNLDIPYDSEDSTNIYLRGTEPIEDLNAPEKEPVYSFPSEVIDQLAYAIQQKTNDYTLSTVQEYTERVHGIEQYEPETKTISPDFSTGDMVVTPTDGSLLSEVTIQKPDTLLPENIALGVNIAGVVGTLEAGTSDDVRYVTFMNGSVELYKKPVAVGDDCVDVLSKGLIETPTKEADAQYSYTYYGWGASDGGAADSTILQNITDDKTVYAIYTKAVNYYTITWLDDDGTTLKTETLAYGATPSYTPQKEGYILTGWNPEIASVTGDITYTAVWAEGYSFASTSWAKIAEICEAGQASQYFAIGDTREEDFGFKTNPVKLMIIGFDHDDLADGSGKAAMTIGMTNHHGTMEYYNALLAIPSTHEVYQYTKAVTYTLPARGTEYQYTCEAGKFLAFSCNEIGASVNSGATGIDIDSSKEYAAVTSGKFKVGAGNCWLRGTTTDGEPCYWHRNNIAMVGASTYGMRGRFCI